MNCARLVHHGNNRGSCEPVGVSLYLECRVDSARFVHGGVSPALCRTGALAAPRSALGLTAILFILAGLLALSGISRAPRPTHAQIAARFMVNGGQGRIFQAECGPAAAPIETICRTSEAPAGQAVHPHPALTAGIVEPFRSPRPVAGLSRAVFAWSDRAVPTAARAPPVNDILRS